MEYTFKSSFVKTLVRIGLLALPLLMALLPEAWMNLTVSGVLMLGFDFLKARI